MLRLEGKNAIVTGAGRGIGRAIARKFLQEGARVIACDLIQDRVDSALAELGSLGAIHGIAGDVTDAAFCQQVVALAQDKFGPLHVLANNAGIAKWEVFLDHSETNWDRTLAVNLKAVFILSQHAARAMAAHGEGGAIVNMASTNAHCGERGYAAYNASKAGVLLLTKTMAIELAEHKIRVNCVAPGFIMTELVGEVGVSEQEIRDYLQKIPLRRYGQPDEVANVFAFLACDEASFITGESIVIDGGQLAEE